MSSVICASEAATLALHAAGILAAREAPVSTHAMAQTLGASEATLSKVMQRMVKAGLVTSRRGPHGGFELAKAPGETTLLEVYEAVEGEIEVTRCLLGAPVCGKERCPLGGLFERVSREVAEKLAATTLARFNIPVTVRNK
jgi:Rrf2 family nitric oxide-sensitive transcriptional repressor